MVERHLCEVRGGREGPQEADRDRDPEKGAHVRLLTRSEARRQGIIPFFSFLANVRQEGVMIACPEHRCETCGNPLTGRERKKSCSARCRAALSRKKKAEAQEDRDERLQRLVKTLAREVGLRPEDLI